MFYWLNAEIVSVAQNIVMRYCTLEKKRTAGVSVVVFEEIKLIKGTFFS